ncbi:MAG: hypothetical protein ACJAZO_005186 [Myxococcota bacterium]|jgi:hypothetical protein
MQVEGRDKSEVVIGPLAVTWLKDMYGPDAWEWIVCDAYGKKAMAVVVATQWTTPTPVQRGLPRS